MPQSDCQILRLHSEVVGKPHQGDILILHGLFGALSNWRSIARMLGEQWRVHSLDLRNHGDSPWADDMSYPAMARDIVAYIDANRLQTPHIIGHSMGGKVVLTLLATAAQIIGRGIAIDIAPVRYHHDHNDIMRALAGVHPQSLPSRKAADQVLAGDLPDAAVRQFLLQNLKKQGSGYAWRINLNAIMANRQSLFDFPRHLGSTKPVRVIHGANSTYVTPALMAQTLERFPAASFTRVEGAGHWLHVEQPQRLIDIIHHALV